MLRRVQFSPTNGSDNTPKVGQKKGFLRKQGGFFGTFQRNWVVLENRTLCVYSLPSDRTASFVIPLNGASAVIADHLIGKKHSLAVFPSPSAQQTNTYPGAPLHLLAESEDERNDWLQFISNQISSIHSEAAAIGQEGIAVMIEAMLDSVIVSDGKGKITAFNACAEQMFGWSAEEIIGKNVTSIMPQTVAIHHPRLMETYSRSKKGNLIGKPRKITAQRKDGSSILVEISLGELPHMTFDEGAHFMAVFRDIQAELAGSEDKCSEACSETEPTISDGSQKSPDAEGGGGTDWSQISENVHQQDSTSTLDALSDQEEATVPPLGISDVEQARQTYLLTEQKLSLEKLANATTHLDSIVHTLVQEAGETSETQFRLFLQDRMSQFNKIKELAEQARERSRELEAQNRQLKACLVSRTESVIELQKKLETLSQQQQQQPSAPSPAPPVQPPPTSPRSSQLIPTPPVTKKQSATSVRRHSVTELQPELQFDMVDVDNMPKLSSSLPDCQVPFVVVESPPPRGARTDQPPVVPACRSGFSSPFSVDSPVDGTSCAEGILSLHSVVTKLLNFAEFQRQVEWSDQSIEGLPDTANEPPSSVLKFDLAVLEQLYKFHEKQVLSSPFHSFKFNSPKTSTPTSALPPPPTMRSARRRNSFGLGSRITEMSEPELRKANTKCIFHILLHKSKLRQIQDAVRANTFGLNNAAISNILKRFESNQREALDKWQRRRTIITVHKEQLERTTIGVWCPQPPRKSIFEPSPPSSPTLSFAQDTTAKEFHFPPLPVQLSTSPPLRSGSLFRRPLLNPQLGGLQPPPLQSSSNRTNLSNRRMSDFGVTTASYSRRSVTLSVLDDLNDMDGDEPNEILRPMGAKLIREARRHSTDSGLPQRASMYKIPHPPPNNYH